MPGTRAGAKKTASKVSARDPEFYRKIGKKGAEARKKKYLHFSELKESDPDSLRAISAKGGNARSKSLKEK